MHDVSSGNIYRKIPVLCTAAKCVCIGSEFCDTLTMPIMLLVMDLQRIMLEFQINKNGCKSQTSLLIWSDKRKLKSYYDSTFPILFLIFFCSDVSLLCLPWCQSWTAPGWRWDRQICPTWSQSRPSTSWHLAKFSRITCSRWTGPSLTDGRRHRLGHLKISVFIPVQRCKLIYFDSKVILILLATSFPII